ncbi:hypothetical protein LK08_06295 [Streptomyces sp. MUSC 125]|uniref:hypothetical protein n=1 Tax=unclassified Streptomyces TaxID=2593676 RepID=UPI00057EDFD0|nr:MULTISPECIES: hypothetical protein [unclassified Streptomyces]KIE27848.1 hypothetical protein LK08_06295 [Streptomyces sp. MUSC 125]MCH0558517.1 hypothetical protein [Streptomyces sp. MUM 16J]
MAAGRLHRAGPSGPHANCAWLVAVDLQNDIVALPTCPYAMTDSDPKAHAGSVGRIFPGLGESGTPGES